MLVIRQTNAFATRLNGLRDRRVKRKIAGWLQRLKFGHFGDVEPVGQGVSALRIHEGTGNRYPAVRRRQRNQQKDSARAHRIRKEPDNET